LVLEGLMAVSQGQEHNGLRVVLKLSEGHRARLHAVLALVEVAQSQRVVEGHTGLECLLAEDRLVEKSPEEDQLADPLVEVEVEVSTLLQERMGLVVDQPWLTAGLGTEKLQHSLEYCGVTQALADQNLECRSMLGYDLCWLLVQWKASWRSYAAEVRSGAAVEPD
jgi:hypothetical protein